MHSDWLTWVAVNLPAIVAALFAGVGAFIATWNHRIVLSTQSVLLTTPQAPPPPVAQPSSLESLPTQPTLRRATDAPAVTGGGNASGAFPLHVLPAWSEQRVTDDSGNPAAGHNGLCGEVCCSAIIAAVHGVPTDPTDHRIHVHGYNGSSLTNCEDLSSILQYCSIGASPRMVDWPDAHLLMVARLGLGCYTIMLVAPDWVNGALHWVVPVSLDGMSVLVFDPWDGMLRSVSLAQLATWYSGQMVTTSARAHYDCRGWAMPPS